MENNQLPLVTFEQAQRLKKMGFDWNTRWYYRNDIPSPPDTVLCSTNGVDRDYNASVRKVAAPTIALALQYMRNVHNLCGDIYRIACGWVWSINKADSGTSVEDLNERGSNDGGAFDDFDDCASNVLDELLTLIEK